MAMRHLVLNVLQLRVPDVVIGDRSFAFRSRGPSPAPVAQLGIQIVDATVVNAGFSAVVGKASHVNRYRLAKSVIVSGLQ
jgi:hypothetical protein